MFRAAGKRLLRAGKIRRRSFFSERELFLFRDQTFFSRSDSPDREKDQGNGNFSRRKETLSMSFVTEDSNFFQLLGYIFSAFKRHDTNHAILKYSPFSKKLTYISMPLVSASY